MKKQFKLALAPLLMWPILTMAQVQVDKVIATVAGEPVMQSELDERIKVNMTLNQRAPSNMQQTELVVREASQKELIMERLLLNRAKAQNIVISDDELQKGLTQVAQNAGLPSVQEFQKVVIQKDGEKAWKMLNRDLRNQMTIDALMARELTPKIKQPTDAEIQEIINKEKANPNGTLSPKQVAVTRHIFIAVKPNQNEAQALKKAQSILASLKKGEKFEDLAKKYSDNPETAARGGLIPMIDLGDTSTDPNLLKAAKEQKENVVGQPIKTKNGYHILEVAERTEISPTADDEKRWAQNVFMFNQERTLQANFLQEVNEEAKSLVELKN